MRVAALPLIALFANITVPTQAALPTFNTDWNAIARVNETDKGERLVSLGDTQSGRSSRWWAMRRAPWQVNRSEPADPDQAIVRPFQNDTNDPLVAAYEPAPGQKVVTPFDALFAAAASPRGYPQAPDGAHAWMKRPVPAHMFMARQQACLATAIYFEARGETRKGQAAVAQVILNRVLNPAYPDTACGVVYQNAEMHNRCQFSFACDDLPDTIGSRSAYTRAEEIAMAVTSGAEFLPEVGSSTHYFADRVQPAWASRMQQMASIGAHRFFRTFEGGWK